MLYTTIHQNFEDDSPVKVFTDIQKYTHREINRQKLLQYPFQILLRVRIKHCKNQMVCACAAVVNIFIFPDLKMSFQTDFPD